MAQATQIIRRISAEDVPTIENLLNSAVEALIPEAIALGQGIKVTRVGPGEYTAEAAPDVPCGYTIYKAR